MSRSNRGTWDVRVDLCSPFMYAGDMFVERWNVGLLGVERCVNVIGGGMFEVADGVCVGTYQVGIEGYQYRGADGGVRRMDRQNGRN